MAIHRRFLYAGLFLVAVGGVLVVANITGVNEPWLREALRLWPLVIIAIGLAIVVRRTRFSLPAGVLAAVAPGLLIGGSMVAGPRAGFECGHAGSPARTFAREGEFSGAAFASRSASVALSAACGSTTITTAAGNGWSISAGSTDGREPDVNSDELNLEIRSTGRGGRQLLLGDRREDWDVTLPTTPLAGLSLTSTGNTMNVALPGASIGAVAIEADLSTFRLDATGAEIDELDVEVNLGSATIVLPATRRLGGNLEVNGGRLRLCQPMNTAMTVAFGNAEMGEVTVAGQRWTADVWSGGNVLSNNQIDLTVDATFGSIEINPIGGCS